MRPARPKGERGADAGVTLIEMLVSLVIFAIVGVASFAMIDTLLQVRNRTEGRLETMAQIDRALSVFTRDFAQGDPITLRLDDESLSILRAADQRHNYTATPDEFIREIAPETGTTPPLRQVLLGGVQGITFSVLDGSNDWQSGWPPDDPSAHARAVRLVLTLDLNRDITRLVPLTDVVLP